MKVAVFDLEIVKTVTGVEDWFTVAPLGISCIACALSDSDHAIVWHGHNELGQAGSRAAVTGLTQLVNDGYTLAGFNSLGFDFRVLSIESGMVEECKSLALNHIDLYFHLFCLLGYGPGLDRLAEGMGTPRKSKGIDGALAPEMWRNGQRQTVIDYCVQDVRATLALIESAINRRGVTWISKNGNRTNVQFEQWLSVAESSQIPLPDVSWMPKPWPREKFSGWLHETDR